MTDHRRRDHFQSPARVAAAVAGLAAVIWVGTLIFDSGSGPVASTPTATNIIGDASGTVTSVETTEVRVGPTSTGSGTIPGQLDLAAGEKLFDSIDQQHEVYAIANRDIMGCEGEPAYDIWSVPTDGSEPMLAVPHGTFGGSSVAVELSRFYTDPPNSAESTENHGVWLTTCEEFTSLLLSTELPNGTFTDLRPFALEGDGSITVRGLLWNEEGLLSVEVAELGANATEIRFVTVDAATGAVLTNQPLVMDGSTDCSASGLAESWSDDLALTVAAQETRRQILDAAVACDFARLDEIAPAEFIYSIDPGQDSPGESWALEEYRGTANPTTWLVGLLQLPATPVTWDTGQELYVWPAVSTKPFSEATPDEIDQLRRLGFSEEEIETSAREDIYFGYRLGIDVDGNWLYFLAGD